MDANKDHLPVDSTAAVSNTSSATGAIVGALFGGIAIGVLLVIFVRLFLCRRRRLRTQTSDQVLSTVLETSPSPSVVVDG